jgi:hypothetical protein
MCVSKKMMRKGGKGGRTERVGSLDGHVPCYAGFAIGVGHEARVHASCHLLTGLGKGRLRRGVVLLHEHEHDHVTNCGSDGLGGVEECGCHSSLDGLHSTDNDLRLLARADEKMRLELTVWVAAPEGAAGARLMTCILPWAATRLAAKGSAAAKYFIMTKVLMYSRCCCCCIVRKRSVMGLRCKL